MGRTRDARRVIKVPAVWAGRHAPLTNREDWTREKHKPNAHVPHEHAGLVEWGVRVTRAELLKFLPFGLAATHASRAGGSTGYFGRESMLGIYIDGPSRAVRYSSRAARPGCPCPAASIFPIKFGLVNELLKV